MIIQLTIGIVSCRVTVAFPVFREPYMSIWGLYSTNYIIDRCHKKNEPPAHFARSTHTDDTDFLPPRFGGMEAKKVNRFAIIIKLMPERHLKLLPGQVAQAKNLYFLRMSVCVCG